jgi:hypothetical protein
LLEEFLDNISKAADMVSMKHINKEEIIERNDEKKIKNKNKNHQICENITKLKTFDIVTYRTGGARNIIRTITRTSKTSP